MSKDLEKFWSFKFSSFKFGKLPQFKSSHPSSLQPAGRVEIKPHSAAGTAEMLAHMSVFYSSGRLSSLRGGWL